MSGERETNRSRKIGRRKAQFSRFDLPISETENLTGIMKPSNQMKGLPLSRLAMGKNARGEAD